MMDLSQECPHCNAGVGEICEVTCEVNGKYIKKLSKNLEDLDLNPLSLSKEKCIQSSISKDGVTIFIGKEYLNLDSKQLQNLIEHEILHAKMYY